MNTNIILAIDSKLLTELEALAIADGKSISAFLTSQLEQMVRERQNYAQARGRALARLRRARNLGWTPPRSRDELHER